jgi:hypothetical protein
MKKIFPFISISLGILLIVISGLLFFSKDSPDVQTDEQPTNTTEANEPETFLSPLYLTIVVHTEEDTSSCRSPKANIPDYDGDETLLLHFTDKMREFGKLARDHGAKINFGTDWTFSRGVANFDSTFYQDMEAMGHEIDAHAHASCYNYMEVKEEIIAAGGSPTSVVSGISEEIIHDEFGFFNKLYPEFTILWGVASPGHGAGEEMTSWVWRPSEDNWLEHDPEGKYIHIGHGAYTNSVESLIEAIENRKENTINTYAVFLAPRELLAETGTEGIAEQWTTTKKDCAYWENKLEWWEEFFTELDVYKKSGQLEFASLTEVATIFEEQEDNLIFDQSEIPRSDGAMGDTNEAAGYCIKK